MRIIVFFLESFMRRFLHILYFDIIGNVLQNRAHSVPAHDWDIAMQFGERTKLRTDPDYLLSRVLTEFKKYDTYNRGMITAGAFSKVLDDFELTYGQPEVATILEFCTIDNNGFVLYKELLRKFSPDTPRAKKAAAEEFVLKDNELAVERAGAERAGEADDLPSLHDAENMKE